MLKRTLSLGCAVWLAACARPQAPEEAAPATPAAPAVTTQEVSYNVGDMTFRGYLAYDSNREGPRPGILVVHEWWGHNEYARRRARMLAELGYTAFALDMYGDGKTASNPEEAMALTQAATADLDSTQQRFQAALDVLKAQPTTDPDRVGAIGYCFGGGIVLEMARRGVDLDAVASFHGGVRPEETIDGNVMKARLLIQEGADDPFVSAEQIDRYEAKLDSAGVAYELFTYPGAKHAYSNPDADSLGKLFEMPIAYNAEADRQSWARMTAFFDDVW